MRSIELFAGCGGLAFGLAEAGFEHMLVVERDPQAISTLESNKKRGVQHFSQWNLAPVDAQDVDYSGLGAVDLVSGGPPCQPFSIGGKHKGPSDPRNMWPEAVRAIRELRPKAFLFENVRGLLRPAFSNYLDFLRAQLAWPEIENPGKGWAKHHQLLRRHRRSGASPSYHVVVQDVNAADYGAPQKRHRAIIIGIRSDVAGHVPLVAATHSRSALVWSQRVTKDYWERHKIPLRARPAISDSDRRILNDIMREKVLPPTLAAWSTVRDTIGDLPIPRRNCDDINGHRLHPGARVYPRHTGSTWDEPAKALKAGAHGVPGGENILVGRRGAVRYFTIREMARLQGFPDSFTIGGTWKCPIKQLGNAVPVQIGLVFGTAIRNVIGQ